MFTDKLFLLSLEEVEKFLPVKDRLCQYDVFQCRWWLRSPSDFTSNAAYVCSIGCLCHYGEHVNSYNNAVRPALHLNFDSLNSLKRNKEGYVMFGNREWIVLDEETGLLLAKDAVCLHRFDKKNNSYEISEIRELLNNKLYREMFSEEEQEMIVDTEIHGKKSYAVKSNVPEAKIPHSDHSIDESSMMKMHLLFEELLTETLAAHEKLYQYKQIGTVEEFRSAMETVKYFHTDKKADERMTENEALNILCSELKHHPECSIFYEALSLAISALKEIKQYRENETIAAEFDFDETEEELLRKYSKENKSE